MALYVSHYSCYPIFESAEGGYYYEGVQLDCSVCVRTIEKAKERLAKEAEALGYEVLEAYYEGRKAVSEDYHGKYIGDGSFLIIESRKGMHESGYVPYC